jgi:hypothetical protein
MADNPAGLRVVFLFIVTKYIHIRFGLFREFSVVWEPFLYAFDRIIKMASLSLILP